MSLYSYCNVDKRYKYLGVPIGILRNEKKRASLAMFISRISKSK